MGFIFFIALLFTPAAFVLIEWVRNVTKRKLYELQAEMYTKALENGQSVPLDLFAEPKKVQVQKKSKFRNAGVICTFTGIGIALSCLLMAVLIPDKEAALVAKVFSTIGIMPFFIGIAFLIIHFIEKKKSVGENAQ